MVKKKNSWIKSTSHKSAKIFTNDYLGNSIDSSSLTLIFNQKLYNLRRKFLLYCQYFQNWVVIILTYYFQVFNNKSQYCMVAAILKLIEHHYSILSVTQLCLTLCDPVDCSLTWSSVCGILQVRILEWVAISSSRGYSQLRDQIPVCCISGRLLKSKKGSALSA